MAKLIDTTVAPAATAPSTLAIRSDMEPLLASTSMILQVEQAADTISTSKSASCFHPIEVFAVGNGLVAPT